MNVHSRDPIAGNQRQEIEQSFETHDGTRLFYRHWKTANGCKPRGAILLLHRGHEHGGRMAHLVPESGLDDFEFFAWDARGHGRSEGERGAAPDFACLVRDLDCFARYICASEHIAIDNLAVIAQSVGAVIASTWVHDHAPRIRAMVLAAPAFEVNLIVPFARNALNLWHRVRGDFSVRSYVTPRMLTQDAGRAASYGSDPLVTRAISANVLLDLYETAGRVIADARAITTPTQVLISGADKVVKPAPQHRFFENLGSARKERHVFAGLRHDILGERDRAPAMAELSRFLNGCFAEPAVTRDLLDADRSGYTRDETDRLQSPVQTLSPKGLAWLAMRAAIGIGGRLSRGIGIGRQAGFDSGAALDHVYRNRAEGAGPLGRWVDRVYLNSVGWRGIRARKLNAEAMIAEACARLRGDGHPVRIVDIAAGRGRYVLDAIAGMDTAPDAVLLRDYCRDNVASGRALIERRGFGELIRFEEGDAFDGAGLARLKPRPTLAIVSGLFELYADNGPVLTSLRGLAGAVPAGGLLIYTNQPWHPQIEMIARTLTSHRGGRPWVMRRRTQGEMDQLVAAAGFRKIGQRIDRWGIFSVSLAERVPS